MMVKPPYVITSKMLSLTAEITEQLTKLEYTSSHNIPPRLRKINRIKTIAGTLEIEGNFIGEEKITAILEGKRVLGTYEEILEVEGAINAYNELENYNHSNIQDLLRAHKILMQGILKTAGTFRNINVGVGNKEGVTHIAPQPHLVPQLMQDLFTWLQNSDEHPLIKSSVFHYEFEFIHPFSDGNGRIGRLWQSVILYHWKSIFSAIPTESIIRDHQEHYYRVLEASGSLGESTPFIEFMLEVILDTVIRVGNQVGNKVGNTLSENQRVILEQLARDPKISAEKLSHIVGISKRKIEENLAKLKAQGKIIRIGKTRGHWAITV